MSALTGSKQGHYNRRTSFQLKEKDSCSVSYTGLWAEGPSGESRVGIRREPAKEVNPAWSHDCQPCLQEDLGAMKVRSLSKR